MRIKSQILERTRMVFGVRITRSTLQLRASLFFGTPSFRYFRSRNNSFSRTREESYQGTDDRREGKVNSPLFEIARVFVCLDDIAYLILSFLYEPTEFFSGLCGLLSTGTALRAKAATIRQQHHVRWAWCIH
jgi:hypothetical protein